MKIGELSKICGCPPETIRYFEKIDLLPPSERADNGYRIYERVHLQILRFILRSRNLGFRQQDVKRLVDLAARKEPPCSAVHDMLDERVAEVRDRIREMRRMERALLRLRAQCRDGTLQECPVIDELLA